MITEQVGHGSKVNQLVPPNGGARKVLLVEDDETLAELVASQLRADGFTVRAISNGATALTELQSQNWDLILLDVVLPGIDGHELCRQIRSQPRYTPIIMTSVRSSELHRVLGLELGADDYVPKPYSVMELVARVRSAIRRTEALLRQASNQHSVLRVGDFELNAAGREVRISDRAIELTPREFDLLSFLTRNPGKVFSRTDLLDHVWGYQYHGYEHTVNTHINRLRLKIEDDPTSPERIVTVWGRGYKFCLPNSVARANQ